MPAADASEFADDVHRLLDELAASLGPDRHLTSGECRPAIDVLETDGQMEILVDAAGITPASVRIACRDTVVLIVGEKAPPGGHEGRAYHLIEREFGRFARVVRLAGAYDVAAARATIANGELSIVLPKIADRRGQLRRISITTQGSV